MVVSETTWKHFTGTRMKYYLHIWIVLFCVVCSAKGGTTSGSEDADVSLIRDVLSRSHLLNRPVSSYRLREMANWLNSRYPQWHHLPSSNLQYLLGWHNQGQYGGYPSQLGGYVPWGNSQGHSGASGSLSASHSHTGTGSGQSGSKPSGQVINPPGQHHYTGSGKPVDVTVDPLEFDSWFQIWTEEELKECGEPEVETHLKMSRVYGGHTTRPGTWPWMVSLRLEPMGQHWCGGVVIAKQWILTAAHCMHFYFKDFTDPSYWTARLGKFNTTVNVFETETEQDMQIEKILVHPDFTHHTVYQKTMNKTFNVPENDIALMKLAKPATLTKWVKPLCLPHNDEVPENGQRCVISGWGSTENEGFPGVLNEASIPVYGYRRCRRFPGYAALMTDNQICAGRRKGGVDTCHLDSGGPLHCMFNNRWVIAGITSYGDAGDDGCAKPLRPGIYTKTVNFVEWIHAQIYGDYRDNFNTQK